MRLRRSAVVLDSEGRWATPYVHLYLAARQAISRATAPLMPDARIDNARFKEPVLSPQNIRLSRMGHHRTRHIANVRNSQNVWKAQSPTGTFRWAIRSQKRMKNSTGSPSS